MSARYKVHDDQIPHFVTSTVVGWVDAFSREYYKELLCDSLVYCQEKKGMILHAWVIMSNHIHLIVSAKEGHKIGFIMRDLKKFTSKKITDAIANADNRESRREWMLNMFGYVGRHNNDNEENQFWQQEYHPIALDTEEKLLQRLNYLHENPVRGGSVWKAEEYKYSSAIDYFTSKKGVIPITRLQL